MSVRHFLKQMLVHQPVMCIAWGLVAAMFCLVPPDKRILNDIDWRVIGLLYCLMVVVMAFRRMGGIDLLSTKLIGTFRTLRRLSIGLVVMAFFSSMLLTNDVALISIVPLTMVILSRSDRLHAAARLVTLETIAANLGSMATPLGNPQNLFLYTKFQLTAGAFFSTMIPLSALSFVLLVVIASFAPCDEIHRDEVKPLVSDVQPTPVRMIVTALFFILSILAVFRIVPVFWVVLAVSIGYIRLDYRSVLKIDYGLLATFVAFFIFVGMLQRIDAIHAVLGEIVAEHTLASGFALSQIISNVPAAILLSGFTKDVSALLAGVNIGGLGTLVASLASLIAFQGYIKACHDSKRHFLCVFTTYNAVFAFILLAYWHFISA